MKLVKKNGSRGLATVAIPVVTLTGFTVIAETVFVKLALSRVVLAAISSKDISVVMGTVMISALACVTINLIVDLIYLAI